MVGWVGGGGNKNFGYVVAQKIALTCTQQRKIFWRLEALLTGLDGSKEISQLDSDAESDQSTAYLAASIGAYTLPCTSMPDSSKGPATLEKPWMGWIGNHKA